MLLFVLQCLQSTSATTFGIPSARVIAIDIIVMDASKFAREQVRREARIA